MNILNIEDAKKVIGNRAVVIVTGVTGQDGSLMVDYLLRNPDYVIFGGVRHSSGLNCENIIHLSNVDRFFLVNFDLTDEHSIETIVRQLNPSYFINFAAQSSVKSSWDFPTQTWDVNTRGIIHILEAIRRYAPVCRFFNDGSSDEFGNVTYSPQDEQHPLRPRSPYGASKASARQLVKVYRESYNIYTVQGWMFNHESVRRGEEFVTRKITKGLGVLCGKLKTQTSNIIPLELGNINVKRDWSAAEDCIDAIWRMLNQDEYNYTIKNKLHTARQLGECSSIAEYHGILMNHLLNNPCEYVVSSGENHTIKTFIKLAMESIGIVGEWIGSGIDEVCIYKEGYYTVPEGTVIIKINPSYYRPAEIETICGNSFKIKSELGWQPKIDFKRIVRDMILHDVIV